MDAHLTRPGWKWVVLGLPTGQGTLISLCADEGRGLGWRKWREMGGGRKEETEIFNK